MKRRDFRLVVLFLLLLISMICLSGCKASKKKVEESTYYKELQTKYEKLKKENKKLKEESENQEQVSDAEKRAENYLAKIARDRLINLEVGYADNMEGSEMISVDAVYDIATRLAQKADRTSKYTPEQLEKVYDKRYQYILYDEDNAIYEITIYGKNYVVFSDLPKYVYYVPDAAALGEAFLRYRVNYPTSKLLHRLADCPIMVDHKNRSYESNVTAEIATYISHMDKVESSRKKAEKVWAKAAGKKDGEEEKEEEEGKSYEPDSSTYTFYHHGNTMTLTLYDQYIAIKNVDEKYTWFKVDKTKIQEIKDILKKDRDRREAMDGNTEKKDSENEKNSHSKEIEEESVINGSEDAN